MGNTQDVCDGALSPQNAIKPQQNACFVIKSEWAFMVKKNLFGEILYRCIVSEMLLEPGDM